MALPALGLLFPQLHHRDFWPFQVEAKEWRREKGQERLHWAALPRGLMATGPFIWVIASSLTVSPFPSAPRNLPPAFLWLRLECLVGTHKTRSLKNTPQCGLLFTHTQSGSAGPSQCSVLPLHHLQSSRPRLSLFILPGLPVSANQRKQVASSPGEPLEVTFPWIENMVGKELANLPIPPQDPFQSPNTWPLYTLSAVDKCSDNFLAIAVSLTIYFGIWHLLWTETEIGTVSCEHRITQERTFSDK